MNVVKKDISSEKTKKQEEKNEPEAKSEDGLIVTVFPCGKESAKNKEPYELVIKSK